MKMRTRKYGVLAAAAMASVPAISHASIAVTFSYDTSTLMYSTSSNFATFTAVPIVGGAVSVPVNDYFRFGVDVSVTGDTNPSSGGTYDQTNGSTQPANLGLAAFGFAFNLSSPVTTLAPFQRGAGTQASPYTSRAAVSTSFGTTSQGNVNILTGQVGTGGAYLSGGNNVNVVGTTSNYPVITVGAGSGGTQAFTNLIYKAGPAAGQSTITAIIPTGADAITILDPTYTPSTSTPPDYVPATTGFTTNNLPALVVNVTGGAATTGSNRIVSLVTTGSAPTGTAPNGYGSTPLGTLSVQFAGGSGKYFPGYLNISGGATSGYVAVKGFAPGDSPEIYALQVAIGGVVLSPTDTRLAAIITDIKAGDDTTSINNLGVTAVSGSPYASLFPGYDILVPSSVAGGAAPYFAFDFSSAGTDTTYGDPALGNITVTAIAAVPEPATAAGVILGAAGLLLGRRKNRATA